MNNDKNVNVTCDPIVPLDQFIEDDRGIIKSLISFDRLKVQSALIIESLKGSIRANHYHKQDWHYCYVISGSIEYYERKVGDNSDPILSIIKTGEMFYTGPMVEHAMVFPEDTIFLTLAGGTRSQKDYEADLVRVNLI